MTQTEFSRAIPIYETFPGWTEDISAGPQPRRPAAATRATTSQALEKMIKAPISAIGVGPGRDETIAVRDLLD